MNSALYLLLAQFPNQGQPQADVDLGPLPAIILGVELVLLVLLLASLWKIFVKAGEPGWAAIVPFYNSYMLVKIVNRPWWWFILTFIPCVGIVIFIILYYDLCKSFGKGAGFFIGVLFLPFIFLPLLAFGDATYYPVKREPGAGFNS